jgi:hypothetical protein
VLLILVVLTLRPLGDALANRTAALSLYGWLLLRSASKQVEQCIRVVDCAESKEDRCTTIEPKLHPPPHLGPADCLAPFVYMPVEFLGPEILQITALERVKAQIFGPIDPKLPNLELQQQRFLNTNAFAPIVSSRTLGRILAGYAFKVVYNGNESDRTDFSVAVVARPYYEGKEVTSLEEAKTPGEFIEFLNTMSVNRLEQPRDWVRSRYHLRLLGNSLSSGDLDRPTDLDLTSPLVDAYVRQAFAAGYSLIGVPLNACMAWGGNRVCVRHSDVYRVRRRALPVSSARARRGISGGCAEHGLGNRAWAERGGA